MKLANSLSHGGVGELARIAFWKEVRNDVVDFLVVYGFGLDQAGVTGVQFLGDALERSPAFPAAFGKEVVVELLFVGEELLPAAPPLFECGSDHIARLNELQFLDRVRHSFEPRFDPVPGAIEIGIVVQRHSLPAHTSQFRVHPAPDVLGQRRRFGGLLGHRPPHIVHRVGPHVGKPARPFGLDPRRRLFGQRLQGRISHVLNVRVKLLPDFREILADLLRAADLQHVGQFGLKVGGQVVTQHRVERLAYLLFDRALDRTPGGAQVRVVQLVLEGARVEVHRARCALDSVGHVVPDCFRQRRVEVHHLLPRCAALSKILLALEPTDGRRLS